MRNAAHIPQSLPTPCPRRSLAAGARWLRAGVSTILLGASLGCGAAPPPPPATPPYVPNYAYQPAAAAAKQADVTVAVVNPVIKGTVRGADGAAMLKALPTALADLITAKGMKYRGPIDNLEAMTFPEKKGSDLALYAEVEVDAGWQPTNLQNQPHMSVWSGQSTVTQTCDVSIAIRGG